MDSLSEDESIYSKPRKSRSSSNKQKGSRKAGGRPSAKEAWLSSIKTAGGLNGKKANVGKRSTVEYWSQTLRQTGGGISTESISMSGLKGFQGHNMSYNSTSHYLRQVVGTEKSSKGSDTVRSSRSTPAYKSPEEYYDEILALKKQMGAVKNDNSALKSKLRRLEEDNLKKEKEINQLLDPSMSDDVRRTLADKKPDTSTVIHSLKQKLLKMEHQLRDKEAAYNKLQSDLKTTKIEEMKSQMEVFYAEIVRLKQRKTVDEDTPRNSSKRSTPVVKESPSKIKALQDTIMRMNETNTRLQQENKTLKEDLERLMDENTKQKEAKKDYEDMNKRQLLDAIGKLERKLDRSEADNLSLQSDHTVQGKITLEGTLGEKLTQLDQRETELLEETEKQKSNIKKLQEDRVYYRKKAEDKDKEIKSLKKEIDQLQAELDSFYDKDKSVTPRVTPRKPSPRRARSRTSSVSSETGRLNKREERERQRRVEDFTRNRAAKKIQTEWRSHRRQEEEMDEATEMIQAAMRGHLYRKNYHYESETEETTDDYDRGRSHRKGSGRRSPTRSSSRKRRDSTEEESDEIVTRRPSRSPSAGRQSPPRRSRSPPRRSRSPSGGRQPKSPPRRPTSARSSPKTKRLDRVELSEEDDDSDDDIVVTSKPRGKFF